MKTILLGMLIVILFGVIAGTTTNQVFAQGQPADKPVPAKNCSVKDKDGNYINEGRACVVSTSPYKSGTCQGGVCK